MSTFKLNIQKFIVYIYSTLLSASFFFLLRRVLLRIYGVKVGQGVTFHRGIKLFCLGGFSLGDFTTVNYGCYLDARGGLFVGRNVNISHCVKIYTMGHDLDDPMCQVVSAPVRVCDNAWIFPNVLIMPGVTVGEGAVIYPGSVVVKDVEPYSICGGNPARMIRKRNNVISYKASYPIWFGI